MNLKQLEAFVYIAEGKSFSQAAKALYLTQPTISAHIFALEQDLNARLFIRNTKEVKLSSEGERLYGYAIKMIELQKEISEAFGIEIKGGNPCICIAASTVHSQYILPELMTAFTHKYKGQQFQIVETDSMDVIEQVVNHSVDIGFIGTSVDKRQCKCIPFYQDNLVIITPNSEKYRKIKEAQEPSIEWILEEAILIREEGSGTRKESEKLLEQCGIQLENLQVVATIQNTEAIKSSVIKGMGIAILSQLTVQEEVEKCEVLVFPFPHIDNTRELSFIYNQNFKLSTSARNFVHMIKEKYLLEVPQNKRG